MDKTKSQLHDPFSFVFHDMSALDFNAIGGDDTFDIPGLELHDLLNLGHQNESGAVEQEGEEYYPDYDVEGADEGEREQQFYDDKLTRFALKILSQLKTLPFESRTRCLQPFLLVALCSELRLPPQHNSNDAVTPLEEINIVPEAIEVSRTRRFLLGRLSSLQHVLPPKPIDVCLKLVREVWARMDSGLQGVYWVDVMIEKSWETTMG